MVRGVKFGEYRFDKEEFLAMIAAQQYYVEHGDELKVEKLVNSLPNYIPDHCLQAGEKSIDKWASLIVEAHKKVRKQCIA